MELVLSLICLLAWIAVTFVFPLGPKGTPLHLLLGAAVVLFIRWYALRDGGRVARREDKAAGG
jgi:hypothetical protein